MLLKNAKLKYFEIQNVRKIADLKCREICAPQNRDISVSRKVRLIRYEHHNMDS